MESCTKETTEGKVHCYHGNSHMYNSTQLHTTYTLSHKKQLKLISLTYVRMYIPFVSNICKCGLSRGFIQDLKFWEREGDFGIRGTRVGNFSN